MPFTCRFTPFQKMFQHILLFVSIGLIVLRVQVRAQTVTTSSTTAGTTTRPSTGSTVTGLTGTGSTVSGTVPSTTPSINSTATSSTVSETLPPSAPTAPPAPPIIGAAVGRCPIIPTAPNVTIQTLNGMWYVMRYQPANPGPIDDQCDRMQITTSRQINQITLSSVPVSQPLNQYTRYNTESAQILPNTNQGTFMYTMPGYGNNLQGYVTIVSYIPDVGFIYNVCWLNDPTLQNLVLFAAKEPNPAVFDQLMSIASYWQYQWTTSMQFVNHVGCP